MATDQRSLCVQCGALLPESVTEEFVVDGRYQVEAKVGEGSMGVVYLCRDMGLERRVAVKILPPDFIGRPEVITRFRREASTLAQVRNQHVVQIYAFGTYGDTYFFAMEFVRGATLEDSLAKYRAQDSLLPVERTVQLVRQLASALDEVHALDVVHRDLKPANILLEETTGRPVIIDFGLARGVRSGSRRHSMRGGTPSYSAPEQMLGGEVTPRSDQYALACIAFEMLTGREPFTNEDTVALLRSHVREEPPRPSALRPELARFDAVVSRALAKNPLHRFDSCTGFALALEKASKIPITLANVASESTGSFVLGGQRSGTRIFVVDYDEKFLKLAARAAQVAFFGKRVKLVACSTAADVMDHVAKAPPELLIATQYETGPDCAALVRMLRAYEEDTHFEVLMLGPRWEKEDRARFEALDVHEFLLAPVQFSQLAETLQNIAVRKGWVERAPAEESKE